MPIYEFYCSACHTVFSFLSKRVDTGSTPPCPRCRRALSRQVSLFAAARGGKESDAAGADDGLPVDDARLERAMESMAGQIEGLDENNPRQAAQAMRQLAAASGLRLNATVNEALSRMEAGEDPEAIEQEYGDALEADNPFETDGAGRQVRGARRAAPARDSRLYEL
ncbi:MAG: zinc ribbon domain-containing protein [Kiritimatiellae bacterium]|nr:zinc ribbon domain-containing protein [Kiritimatiellia bacterium]